MVAELVEKLLRGVRRRFTLLVASAALVVACTGVTPADAVRTVRRAVFAKNAAAVNGIKASRSPRPGSLVPLGSDGRFPQAVLPPGFGARGPRGPEGPAGAAGERGPSNIFVATKDEPVRPGMGANSFVDVLALSDVPAGDYWASAFTNAQYTGSGSNYFRCDLLVNGEPQGSNTAVSMGFGDGAVIGAIITRQDPVRLTVTSLVKLRCGHENALSDDSGRFERSRLALIRTSDLVVSDQG
jgi:hypothetical protein